MSINSCLNNYYGKSLKKKMIAIIGHRMDNGMVNPLLNINGYFKFEVALNSGISEVQKMIIDDKNSVPTKSFNCKT